MGQEAVNGRYRGGHAQNQHQRQVLQVGAAGTGIHQGIHSTFNQIIQPLLSLVKLL